MLNLRPQQLAGRGSDASALSSRRIPTVPRRSVARLEVSASMAGPSMPESQAAVPSREGVRARVLMSPNGVSQTANVDGHVEMLRRYGNADGNLKERLFEDAIKAAAAIKVR